jgi:hypothetical protein
MNLHQPREVMEQQELSLLVERNADSLAASFELYGTGYCASISATGGLGSESDSLLALGLLPAMLARRRLALPEAVSPRLLSAAPEIQNIYHAWERDRFGRVAVAARVREGKPLLPASGIGCFFSGGVDSFYTLLKRREEVTHLIFAHGFDISLADSSRRKRALDAARAVADELGKSLIEVHTNLAPVAHETGVGWKFYHGAALATVALLIHDRLGKVLIPATFSYAKLLPWGSHPLLDPLWSTEQMTIEHDGCEATRVEKTAYISEYPVAMRYLRVCLARDTDYNCGRCEKCIRTIINLRAAGASGRCETLPEELDPATIASIDLEGDEAKRLRVLENLRALERSGNEPELVSALQTVLERNFEGEGTRRQLEITRAELEELKSRFPRLAANRRQLAARSERLGMQNERLASENARLITYHSSRRYQVADVLADAILKVPGIKRVLDRDRDAHKQTGISR